MKNIPPVFVDHMKPTNGGQKSSNLKQDGRAGRCSAREAYPTPACWWLFNCYITANTAILPEK
jgi:hypothetical protein